MAIELLGIDNVIFDVDDLDAAVAFYLLCGFQLRWRLDEKGIALFSIGSEPPGLLLRRSDREAPSGCLWVEVANATDTAAALAAAGLQGYRIDTATGMTFEVRDPSGNRVGFADYSRRPDLGRSPA